MAFTFTIIEWANVNDPNNIFPKTGTSEGDTNSDAEIGDQVSFSAVSTSNVTTGSAAGADDYPDDNGARLYQDVTLNGVTYAAGAEVEADFEVITLDQNSGYYYRVTWLAISNTPVGVSVSRAWDATTGSFVDGAAGVYTPGTLLTLIDGDDLEDTPNIETFATDSNYTNDDGIGNDAVLNQTNGTITCFARGTRLRGQTGEVRVETIKAGDLLWTKDRGLQPVQWVGCRRLSASDLSAMPNLRPIRIRAGALGDGAPVADLIVSPQHRLLVRSKIALRMFGSHEVLVAAKQLLQIDGIDIADDLDTIDYHHILFDRHEVVLSNGAETESLYTGPEALKSVGTAALAEIFTLFPQLDDPDYIAPSARPVISGRQGRKLAVRHAQHARQLVM